MIDQNSNNLSNIEKEKILSELYDLLNDTNVVVDYGLKKIIKTVVDQIVSLGGNRYQYKIINNFNIYLKGKKKIVPANKKY